MLGTYHLNALFDILTKLHFIYEPEKLWQFVLGEACKTLQAEAGTFFEVLEGAQELRVCACHGVSFERLSQMPFKIGAGLSGWVAQYHQPALVNDVRQDHRFNPQTDLITGFATRSILCIPVFSLKRTYGVIEVLNRKSGQFTPQDQEFMTLLGRQTAVAYQNLLLLSEVQQKETLLESILTNFSGGLIAVDQAGKIMIANPAAARLLNLPDGDLVGQPAPAVLKDQPVLGSILAETLREKRTVSRQEIILSLDGDETRFGYTTILIADPQKKVLGSGVLFQKI